MTLLVPIISTNSCPENVKLQNFNNICTLNSELGITKRPTYEVKCMYMYTFIPVYPTLTNEEKELLQT